METWGLILAVVGIAVGAVGVLVGYSVSRRSTREPDPRFAADYSIMKNEVDYLSSRMVTRHAIWNHGGGTLFDKDVDPKNPLRVSVKSPDRIVSASIVAHSKDTRASVQAITAPVKSVKVSFKYLRPGEGFVVEVWHTGPDHAKLSGDIPRAPLRWSGWTWLEPRVRNKYRDPLLRGILAGPFLRWKLPVNVVGLNLLPWVAVAAMLAALLKSPMLVPLPGYDLSTVDGQSAFAWAVVLHGQPSPVVTAGFIAVLVLYVAFMGYQALFFMRHGGSVPYPRTLLAVETARSATATTKPSGSERQPSTSSAAEVTASSTA